MGQFPGDLSYTGPIPNDICTPSLSNGARERVDAAVEIVDVVPSVLLTLRENTVLVIARHRVDVAARQGVLI
jgi:hypothetical protein